MRRHLPLRLLAASLAVAAAILPAAPGSARPRSALEVERSARHSQVREIADGVTYRRYRERGPVVIHVVRIDPTAASTVDVAPGGPRLGTSARTSTVGRAHRALVAINGDFGLLRDTPLHPFQVDGSMLSRGLQVGTNFAMRDDEAASYVDTPRLALTGLHVPSGSTFRIAGWNSTTPAPGAIAGYTAYGGGAVRPPDQGCSARLVRDSPLAWGPGGVGTTRRFVVEAARCAGERRMRRDPGSVVLASRRWGAGAEALSGLMVGQPVRLTWSLGWTRVADTVGGMPRLVADGTVVAPDCGHSFCRRHPRTGIGVTADGTVLFVVVDGRWRRSVGMTLRRFGRTFADLGAVDAVNLDGGGSSTMWIAGRGVVNRPSDPGGERGALSVVMLLRGDDPGSSPVIARDASRSAAFNDAASTGGLAAAWVDGSLVDTPAPPEIRRLAARFARTMAP